MDITRPEKSWLVNNNNPVNSRFVVNLFQDKSLVAILYPKDIAVKFKLPAALSKTVLLKNKASP